MARSKSVLRCFVVFIAACSFSEAQLTSTRHSTVLGSNEIPKEQSNQHTRLTPDHVGVNEPAQTFEQGSNVDDLKLDLIISLLGKLQGQVTELRSKVDKFKSIEKVVQNKPVVLKILPKQECKQKVIYAGPKYEISNCGEKTAYQGGFYLVDATQPTRYSSDKLCQVFSSEKASGEHYFVKTKLYNIKSSIGIDYGSVGLAFNVVDNQNFDFIIFRLHSRAGCYRTGYTQDNKIQWIGSQSGFCPGGAPKGRTWFKVELRVSGSEARISLNGMQVKVFNPHFSPLGRAGVVVGLGAGTLVRFKDFDVSSVLPNQFTMVNCKSYSRISSHYYRLDSATKRYMENVFCLAVHDPGQTYKNYAISATLFNQRGYSGSHTSGSLGLFFNAQDNHNFDFVYFRAGSQGSCYTTGFVQNSKAQWSNSKIGACPGGPFKGGIWNNVTVNVRENDVSVYLDGTHVLSTKGHFPSKPVGGVLLANGMYEHVASFKDYKVTPIEPSNFESFGCTVNTQLTKHYQTLDAKHGKWPESTFCRAFNRRTLPGDYYSVSADLFIFGSKGDQVSGEFVGLAYNVRDPSNYDFFYVRAKQRPCYYTGYVLNGVIKEKRSQQGDCPGSPPQKGTWFKLTVAVRNLVVIVEYNNKHVVTTKPYFPAHGRGGVIVSNGGVNMVTFRNFEMEIVKPLEFQIDRCSKKTHSANGTFVLDGNYNSWPAHLFCSALWRTTLKAVDKVYTVEAMFYNLDSFYGSDWGQPGLMFNAIDANSFNYVYLRIHNKRNCYQFGSVINGRILESQRDSGSCGAMRPKHGAWFRLKLEVSPNNQIRFMIDDVYISSYNAALPWHPRGGALVPNGFTNSVMFRQFKMAIKS